MARLARGRTRNDELLLCLWNELLACLWNAVLMYFLWNVYVDGMQRVNKLVSRMSEKVIESGVE